eukprot:gene8773-7963_t
MSRLSHEKDGITAGPPPIHAARLASKRASGQPTMWPEISHQ